MQFWFELGCHNGKEMSPEDWKCLFKGSMSGQSLVKLAGFDGGSGTSCPVWDKVNVELESKDVLLWDGDWYNDEGWTKVIPEFLAVSQERIAIAFQKRKEVPGFHRSYWHLYKRFPGRIQMVVMEDQENMDAVPPAVKAQLKWLDEEFQSSRLKKPTTGSLLDACFVCPLESRAYSSGCSRRWQSRSGTGRCRYVHG